MTLNSAILDILSISTDLYITGGFIRDYILGIESKDVDIAYLGSVESLIEKLIFIENIKRNSKFLALSFKHKGFNFTITSFRREIFNVEKGSFSFYITEKIEEDVKRRDFTINSLYYNLERGIIDLKGGILDLSDGRIVSIADFNEDPSRVIRALRFKLNYNFYIEKESEKKASIQAKNIISYLEKGRSSSFSESQLVRIKKELSIVKSKDILKQCMSELKRVSMV